MPASSSFKRGGLRQWSTGALVAGSLLGAITGVNAQLALNLTGEDLFPKIDNAETTSLFPMPPCGSFKLEEATIDEMQAAMAAGTLTSVQLAQCYMARVYQTDDYIK